MELLENLKDLKFNNISEYLSISKKLADELNKSNFDFKYEVKIALLNSSTSNGFKEVLEVMCLQEEINPSIFVSEYNQFSQDILDKSSALYNEEPEIVFLNIDTRTLAGDFFFNPYGSGIENLKSWAEETETLLINLINNLLSRCNAKIIISNLEVPTYSPLGLVETKEEDSFVRLIKKINEKIEEFCLKEDRAFLFDLDALLSRIGKKNIFDEKLYYLGDIKIKTKYVPEICAEYFRFVKALKIPQKKCLVLDLDNTLWGGIIGEDGINGIRLGPDSIGKSFLEFQKYILALHKRGVILAINSRNNLEDVLDVFRNHPHMILKEKNFAAMRINWRDKSENLKELAEEINIGLDSMVFFDDDKFNRELVKKTLPMVEVEELPKDFSLYSSSIINSNYFDTLSLTYEDINKGKMYADENQRKNLKISFDNVNDYLKDLNMEIVFDEDNINDIERISQLTHKTNQFNMTTIRYSEEEISNLIENPNYYILTIRLSDKFGDYGLTGVCIIKLEKIWLIETFLMSCRILGRKVEQAIISYIHDKAISSGSNGLAGKFEKTDRNSPAEEVYKNLGFNLDKQDNKLWLYTAKELIPFPDTIKIKKYNG